MDGHIIDLPTLPGQINTCACCTKKSTMCQHLSIINPEFQGLIGADVESFVGPGKQFSSLAEIYHKEWWCMQCFCDAKQAQDRTMREHAHMDSSRNSQKA